MVLKDNMEDFSQLEQIVGAKFKDYSQIKSAFIHRSYLNEHKNITEHNERLEFLGDAVLELIVTEYLYLNFKESEGELTNWRSALVKRETLAHVARKIQISQYIKLSKGEDLSGGREKDYILANTVEAFLGALYFDSGYDVVKKFVIDNILILLKDILDSGLHIDAKSSFQEQSQSIMGFTPEYRTVKEEGPDHEKIFTVGLFLEKEMISIGKGTSKQMAEQNAAEEGLKVKRWGKYRN